VAYLIFNATLPLTALTILLLTVVLNAVFYKPVATVLDERDDYIRNNLTRASEMLSKAEAITKKYEQDLAQRKTRVTNYYNFRSKRSARDSSYGD